MSLLMPRIRKAVNTAAVALVTTAETVVCTLSGVSLPSRDGAVKLRGFAQLTLAATGTTTVTARIRRDSVSGTVVGEGNAVAIPSAAGTVAEFAIDGTDFPGELAGGVYVLTLEQAGSSDNGSCLYATLEAVVGN